jgi:hypothetical protein
MPELPSLALSRRILKYFFNDGFVPIIVYGELRAGKSAYAMKVLIEVISYLYGYKIDYARIRHYWGFHPNDVVRTWLNKGDKKAPVYVWDDAGFWLFSMDWSDPLLISILKYLNVIGTDYGALILTTPDPSWVLSKFQTLHGMIRVKIVHARGKDNLDSDPPDSIKFSRIATGYKPYRSPDFKKTGVNKVFKDEFSCKIPDDLYKDYQPERDHYAKLAKQMMWEALDSKHKITQLNDLRLDRRLEMELGKEIKRKNAAGKKAKDLTEAEIDPDVVIKI